MNDKITFPRLASMLADRSGRSKRFSEDFLREFFTLISEQLEAGESVKVKGLGTFRLSRVEPRRSVDVTTGQPMEISGHSKVVFVPAKELAEAVNAPFEAFTAIEISDGIDLDQLFAFDNSESQDPEQFLFHEKDSEDEDESDIYSEETVTDPTPEATPNYNDIAEYDHIEDSNEEASSATEEPSEEYSESPEESSPESDPHAAACKEGIDSEEAEDAECNSEDAEGYKDEEDAEEEYFDELHNEVASHKKRRRRIFLISFAAALVALIATLAVWYVYFNEDFRGILDRVASSTALRPADPKAKAIDSPSDASPSTTAVDSVDSANDDARLDTQDEEVPTAPSDALVYDTIGKTRYLTTMARSHYGNYNFWPYIYEENKAMLGHPDRIRPGTPVVIPKLSKYGVDPANPEDIEKAKKMGMEIYARYGKKI